MAPHLSSFRTALLLILSIVDLTSSQDRFAGLDDAALLFNGLTPRFYQPAVPAHPALPLENRQDDLQPLKCSEGQHSCQDVGSLGSGVCCDNDRYCFVNSTWQVSCCAIGNVCSDQTPCPSGNNLCNISTTVTRTVTPTASDSDLTPEVVVTTSVQSGCCNRGCGTENIQCPTYFGGQCCGYASQCATGGGCILTVTSSEPPVASPIPSGCTATTQFSCDPADGSGCCAIGQTCVLPSFCSGDPALPTTTNGNLTLDDSSPGLTQQAKAGIGAGVAVGAALLIALLTWFCVRRRREASRRQSTTVVSGGGTAAPNGNNPRGNRHSRHNRLRDGPLSPAAAFFGRGGAGAGSGDREMSEFSVPTSGAQSRPQIHRSGLAYDYLGPDAVEGPFSGDPAAMSYHPGSSPGQPDRGGVPVQPHNANDIMVPVEIDSNGIRKGDKDYFSPGFVVGEREKTSTTTGHTPAAGDGNETQGNGPFELVGSPPLSSPSPLQSPAEVAPSPSPDPGTGPSPELGFRLSPEPDTRPRDR